MHTYTSKGAILNFLFLLQKYTRVIVPYPVQICAVPFIVWVNANELVCIALQIKRK